MARGGKGHMVSATHGKSRTHGGAKSSRGAGGVGTKGGKNIHPKGRAGRGR